MTIGATTGKEPDHVDDGDLKTLDELRGEMKTLSAAKLTMGEKATVQGVLTEVQVLKQQMEMTHEQMRRLIGMYSTLRDEFGKLQEQRVKELNVRINGGSTTAEDIDNGPVVRSCK